MKVLYALRATRSSLAKEAILAKIEYPTWKTFYYAYHIDSMYHMKFKAVAEDSLGEPSVAMFVLLDRILDGELRGTSARDAVRSFAQSNGDLIKLIINKDLACGVTATLFNKVNPGSIPQFKVQLAKEVDISTIDYPVLAQLKYDGVRLIALIENGTCTFKTRNGKLVALPGLAEDIESLPFDNYILDGELVLASGKQEDRTKISGMVNSAMHGGTIDEYSIVLHCFDTMPLSEFNAVKCNATYEDRFTVLTKILQHAETSKLELAITNVVYSAEGATELYKAALALGYEGLVLKYPEHLYTFKRSKDWIKVKEVKKARIKVIDIQDGTGKYRGMIGALVCEGVVEGKHIKVNIGSGLSDIERSLDDIYFLNETIDILYNAVIQDSVTREWSLFLPRLHQIRLDK